MLKPLFNVEIPEDKSVLLGNAFEDFVYKEDFLVDFVQKHKKSDHIWINNLYNLLNKLVCFEFSDSLVSGIKLFVVRFDMTERSKIFLDTTTIPVEFEDLTFQEVWDYIINVTRRELDTNCSVIDYLVNEPISLSNLPSDYKSPSLAHCVDLDEITIRGTSDMAIKVKSIFPDNSKVMRLLINFLGQDTYAVFMETNDWQETPDLKILYSGFKDDRFHSIENLFKLRLWIQQNLSLQ